MKCLEFINRTVLILCIQLNSIWTVENVDQKIIVMISQNQPFAFSETESEPPRGTDISILDNFAKKFGLTIEYIRANESARDALASDHKFQLFLESVVHVDIFAGGLQETIVNRKYLTASQFYHQDYITWCVAKSKSLPILTNIINFCRDPWVYLLSTIQALATMTLVYAFERFEKPPRSDWNRIFMFGLPCYLGFSSAYNPQNNANRILFMIFLLGCFVFTVTFLTYFMNITMSVSYATQVQSIPQIATGEFTLTGDGNTFVKILEQNETYSLESLEKFKFCGDLNICSNELKWNDSLAVAISHERIQKSSLLISSRIFCFNITGSVDKFYLRFLVKRHFRYLKQLNEFLGQTRSNGLITHWLNENLKSSQYIPDEEKVIADTILTIWPFIVSFYSFSILVFLVEQIVFRKVESKAGKMWTSIEMLIDPYRHFLLDDQRY